MVKILLADALSPAVVKKLEAAGHEVRMDPSISDKTLPEHIGDYNVLVVRSTKVTKEAIDASKGLILIVRAGAGVNTIDVAACSAKGVYVCNTPGKNNDAVAELALGHIIACDRRLVANTNFLRNGQWEKKQFLKCEGLRDHKLGIVGRGNIAKSLIGMAKGLGMQIILWSRRLTEEEAEELGVTRVATLKELAQQADVVSVHIAYNKAETHHIINKEFFDAMKKGAIFVNTSRGEVVDTAAMTAAIKEKGILVGLDVYENEPTVAQGPFEQKELAAVIQSGSAHIGASTEQAAEQIAQETFRVIDTFVRTGEPLNCVNSAPAPKNAKSIIIVRHAGIITELLNKCKEAGHKVLNVANAILKDTTTYQATITLENEKPVEGVFDGMDGVIGYLVNKC